MARDRRWTFSTPVDPDQRWAQTCQNPTCAREVSSARFACRQCTDMLPAELRDAVDALEPAARLAALRFWRDMADRGG